MAPVGYLSASSPAQVRRSPRPSACSEPDRCRAPVSAPELEETVRAGGDALKIYQLYVRGDAAWADERLRRVADAGWDAVCVTVDTALLSRRERDIVKGWSRPTVGIEFQARVNWRDVERFRSVLKLPLFLKGIATVGDAQRAVACGVDGIYVSNHGGRQLDFGRGSMDVLPEIVAAVGDRAQVVVDGGFSRGTDIVKAIALGARRSASAASTCMRWRCRISGRRAAVRS